MMVGSESDCCGVIPVVGVPGIVQNLGWNDEWHSPMRNLSGKVLDMRCPEFGFCCGCDRQYGVFKQVFYDSNLRCFEMGEAIDFMPSNVLLGA